MCARMLQFRRLTTVFFLVINLACGIFAVHQWYANQLGLGSTSSLTSVLQYGDVLSAQRAAMCLTCTNQTLCDELGEQNIRRSVAYTGTEKRLRTFLDKVIAGDKFTVAVIGGSVSAGHGLRVPDEKLSDLNLHKRIFNHLVSLSPRKENDHVFVNDAQGGQGTIYQSYCFGEHIPEDVDLILLEIGINDNEDVRWKRTFELMIRGMLSMSSQPAILNLQVFALAFATMRMGGDEHLPIAAHYDLPTLNLQFALQNHIVNHPEDTLKYWFTNEHQEATGVDMRHIGPNGHRAMGDLASIYLDRLICRMHSGYYAYEEAAVEQSPMLPSPEEVLTMPRLLISDKWDMTQRIEAGAPQCFSMNSKKHQLAPSKSEGWQPWSWKDKNYLAADKPGSIVTFPFTVHVGVLEVVYQRSAVYGLGLVDCWIDNNKSEITQLDGWWDLPYNIGATTAIGRSIPAGNHELHCELRADTHDPKGGHSFRFIALQTL